MATRTKKPRKRSAFGNFMDRACDPIYRQFPSSRPKNWVPLEERFDEEIAPPPEHEDDTPRGTLRGIPASRSGGGANVVYVGPPEVNVKRGSKGRRFLLCFLCLGVAAVIARGVQGLVTGNPKPHITVNPVLAGSWPDEHADAFAIRFADTYFAASPGGTEVAAQVFMTTDLRGDIQQSVGGTSDPAGLTVAKTQTVLSAVVTGDARIDPSHALIDVAVTTQSGNTQQYLTYSIPVYRNGNGGLAVYALPAPVPSPPEVPSGTGSLNTQNYSDPSVQTLVQRFFEAWTTNDTTQMSYLSTPGASFLPLPAGLAFKQIENLSIVCAAKTLSCEDPGRNATIDATITLQDTVTDSTVTADYFMQLWQDSTGNWYVQKVNTGS